MYKVDVNISEELSVKPHVRVHMGAMSKWWGAEVKALKTLKVLEFDILMFKVWKVLEFLKMTLMGA